MLSAVVFDLDGTILDNEGQWEEAFRAVAPEMANSNKWLHEPGIGVGPNWDKLVGAGAESQRLAKETRQTYQELGEPKLRDGVVELIEMLKDQSKTLALATGSDWHMVEEELESLGLYLAFEVTTTGDEILAFKPDPEIYLLTAQKLGMEPNDCLVVEDSIAGVTSGHEAGMKVVGIVSEYCGEDDLKAAGADFVLDNIRNFFTLSL